MILLSAVVAVVAAITSAEVEVPVVVAIITLQLRNSVGALDVGGSETVQNHTSLVDQKTNL